MADSRTQVRKNFQGGGGQRKKTPKTA